MNFHVLGLPHTQTTAEWLTCAYTQKVVRFGAMMLPRGHQVFVYSGEFNEAVCTEHIPLLSEAERLEWYPPRDVNDSDFGGVSWDPQHELWLKFNSRAIGAVAERWKPGDILCLSMGYCHQFVADTLSKCLPGFTACEPGVGYEGISTDFRAFESYAWMHHVYGKRGVVNGRYYDCVIPNYFDPQDYTAVRNGGGDYLLFIGRLVERKGPHVAAQIAERAGMRLVVAGPGATSHQPGRIETVENITLEGDIEYRGVVNASERAELMAGAAACLVPTIYIEPFGGVAVEAMLAGCPVVASDYGAFAETVEEGLTGFRFHTLQEGADAVEDCAVLDRDAVRARAVSRFSYEAVAPMYEAWFGRLLGLYGPGWGA